MENFTSFKRKVINTNGFVAIFPNTQDADLLAEPMANIDVFGESATQEFPLGTKLVRGEQVWRYTKNGAVALAAGVPLQSAAAAHAEQEDDIVVAAAAAIGATSVSLTSTANLDTAPNETANNFAEGYLVVNDDAGEGYLYKIKSNAAFASTANSTFVLYDPLKIALATSSQVGLVKNPYSGVIATTAVLTGIPVGISAGVITISYYFWMPTGGPAAVNTNAAITKGVEVVVGTTAAQVDPAVDNMSTLQPIGWAMTPGVTDTETCICFLTLDR